jgi:hypothetical protein
MTQKRFHTNSAVCNINITNFIDQLQTLHVFRKVYTILSSEYSTVYHVISKFWWIKRLNLNQHEGNTDIHSVQEFQMLKNDSHSYYVLHIMNLDIVCEIFIILCIVCFVFLWPTPYPIVTLNRFWVYRTH